MLFTHFSYFKVHQQLPPLGNTPAQPTVLSLITVLKLFKGFTALKVQIHVQEDATMPLRGLALFRDIPFPRTRARQEAAQRPLCRAPSTHSSPATPLHQRCEVRAHVSLEGPITLI